MATTKISYHGPPGMAIGALGVLIPGRTYEVPAAMAKQLVAGRWFTVEKAEAKKSDKSSAPAPAETSNEEAGS